MNEIKKCDSMLKRFLKRKVGITEALVVAFLITGAVGFAASVTPEGEDSYLLEATTLEKPTGPKFSYFGVKAKLTSDAVLKYHNLAEEGQINIDPTEHDGGMYSKYIPLTNEGIIAGTGYGMLADGFHAKVTNKGTISTIGDVGMGAINGGTAINEGLIANTGNYGMYASGGSKHWWWYNDSDAINKGNIENTGSIGMGAFDGANVTNYGTVMNGSEIGMIAVDKYSDADNHGQVINRGDYGIVAGDGAEAKNYGLVANAGNYGMAAFAEVTEMTEESLADELFMFGPTKTKIENHGEIRNVGNYGMLASGSGAEAKNEKYYEREEGYKHGLVANIGDYGMAAFDGGKVSNEGIVQNKGNYGMVAVAADPVVENPEVDVMKYGYDKRSTATNEYNGKISGDTIVTETIDDIETEVIVPGVQNIGMAAFGDALAVNKGLVENSGEVGMYGDNGATIVNRGSDFKNPKEEGEEISKQGYNPDREAGIKNGGNFGMVAVAEEIENPELTLAANFGLVANNGDYGMVAANTGAVALNLGKPSHGDETRNGGQGQGKGNLVGHGKVSNNGDFGMAALNGGVAINTGNVSNNGDVGMIASGPLSIVVNSGRAPGQLFGGGSHQVLIEEEGQEKPLTAQFEEKLDKNYYGPQGDKAESGIFNSGNFGMVAQNGAIAINDGRIENSGNVGMLVYNNSLGVNTSKGSIKPVFTDETGAKVGVYVLGNSAFINNGEITVGEENFAIYGGSGNNAIYLGTGSQIDGVVTGEGGTNTLYFINNKVEEGHEDKILEPSAPNYGKIKAETFAHIAVAGSRNTTDGLGGTAGTVESGLGNFSGDYNLDGDNVGDAADYTLTLDRVMNMRASYNGKTGAGYDGDSNGVLSYNKFNSFQVEGKELDGYENGGRYTGNLVVNGEKDLEGNVTKEGNIILKLAQNRVSTLATGSLKTVIPNMEARTDEETSETIKTDGKVTQRTFDEFFVTDANRIEVQNILLGRSEKTEENPMSADVVADKVEKLSSNEFRVTLADGSDFILAFDNVATGWAVDVEVDPTGAIRSIYTRVGGELPPGGYGESISEYTQSNVDIINAQKITDTGYTYARKAAFLPVEKTITTETVVLPGKMESKPQGKEMVAMPASTPEVATLEKVETKTHNNLQFAEVFGEKGKYDGSTNAKFDYDTWGVTGASFHRFNENWLGGLSYGYAKSDVDYSKGSEKVDTLGLNGLVSYQKDNWLLTGNAGYSWSDHKLNRHAFNRDSLDGDALITVGENHLSSKFDSHLTTLGAELGYNYALTSTSSLYPYVGLDYSWYNRESYKESGADLALALDRTKYDFATSKLGVTFEKAWDKYSVVADLGWKHNFLDNKSDADTYANFYNKASTAKYRIPGLDIGKDVGYIAVAANYDVSPQLTVGADYTGYVRDNEHGNRVGVNFKYKW